MEPWKITFKIKEEEEEEEEEEEDEEEEDEEEEEEEEMTHSILHNSQCSTSAGLS